MTQKWYEKNVAIILLLILVFPVGLFLMWKYSKWNKIVKIVISIFFGLFLISRIGNTQNTTTSTTSKTDTTIVKEKPKEKTEEEKAADEAKKKADEEAKAKADEAAKKAKEEADAKAAADAAAAAAKKAEEEKVAYDTGITYEQLARTPDDYKGKKVKFSGKVVQVMEGDTETDLRIAVDGNYDNMLFVGYDPKITSTRILENDYINVKGTSVGIYSYESTMGGKISIPGLYVDKVELSQ